MNANPVDPGSPRRQSPVWLVAVGGPKLGESLEISPDTRVVLGATAPGMPAANLVHWEVGIAAAPPPFGLAGGVLAGSLGPTGRCNLFPALAKDRFHAGDLLEWGDVAILVGAGPRDASTILVAFVGAEGPAGEGEAAAPLGPIAASLVAPVPIPRVFHSEYSGIPFANCLVCERDLQGEALPYVVEKSYRGRETILECALCMGCAAVVNSEISDQSRRTLEAFGRRMIAAGTGLARCRACQKPRGEMAGFNLMTTCILDQALPPSWMVLCEQCLDGLEATLSKETRDRHREFVTDHFPGLPADLPSPVFFA